jgi:RecA-family ATPase
MTKAAFHFLPLLDVFSNTPPELDFVLPGLLSGTVGSLIGAGATYKSTFALQAAVAVIGARNNLNLAIKRHGKVLYLAADDPKSALIYRLHKLGSLLPNDDRQRVSEGLSIVSLFGEHTNLFDAKQGGRRYENEFVHSEVAIKLVEAAQGKRLIILDTLRRFHQFEESDSGRAALLLGLMEHIANSTGAAVLFLHHTNKGATLSGTSETQQAARGSSVLTDNIRCQYNMVRMAATNKFGRDDYRRWVQLVGAKLNYAADADSEQWFYNEDDNFLSAQSPGTEVGNGNNQKLSKKSRPKE